jgi:hypothetical protein
VILRVDDTDKAIAVLRDSGYQFLSSDKLYNAE